jgi:hypothetical protein
MQQVCYATVSISEADSIFITCSVLTVLVRFVRLAVAGFGRCRGGLLCALGLLLLFPILAHGGSHCVKALVGTGVLLRPACADALPQLLERGFGVYLLVWHGQATSDLASSKQRPIFILTLS